MIMAAAPPRFARWARALGVLTFILLAGCAGRANQVMLPDLTTLAPAPKRMERLIIESADHNQELVGVIQHDHDSLRMALLSPQGQRLLTLVMDSDGPRFLPEALFKPPFSAHWLASRLAWTLWPIDELENQFQHSAWSVRQDDSGHSVYHRGRKVASIKLADQCKLIDDVQTGHRLYIIPIELAGQNKELLCPAV
ncbi:MAG: DUF3261 domain-containing protein [Pseudomonas sp.]|nr:DUF3261 domain-containing protein [Pseudomonas sp.]